MINPNLPLVDLHRHLEGSVRLNTVIEISKKYDLPLPEGGLAGLQNLVWMKEPSSDILKILPRFNLLRQVFVDYDACRQITKECFEDAIKEGLDYVEIRFSSLFMAEPHQLNPLSVTAAVCEAWQEFDRQNPLRSRLIAILSRTYGPEVCMEELRPALAYRDRGIVGLDLAGDEARWPAHLFREHFDQARNAGLKLTAHAGEFAGADSVRETIESLHPDRLGHAVHAADESEVLDLIAKNHIAIECCPTSNYYTGSVPGLKYHPLPTFLKNNLTITLNADDPTLFGSLKVSDEYKLAFEKMGVTRSELGKIQQDGLDTAFLSAAQKNELLKRKAVGC
jgi:adenosine deaminase